MKQWRCREALNVCLGLQPRRPSSETSSSKFIVITGVQLTASGAIFPGDFSFAQKDSTTRPPSNAANIGSTISIPTSEKEDGPSRKTSPSLLSSKMREGIGLGWSTRSVVFALSTWPRIGSALWWPSDANIATLFQRWTKTIRTYSSLLLSNISILTEPFFTIATLLPLLN